MIMNTQPFNAYYDKLKWLIILNQ